VYKILIVEYITNNAVNASFSFWRQPLVVLDNTLSKNDAQNIAICRGMFSKSLTNCLIILLAGFGTPSKILASSSGCSSGFA